MANNKKENKGLDKTSLVMIVVFFVIIVVATAAVFFAVLNKDEMKEQDVVTTNPVISVPDEEEATEEPESKQVYKTYEELADAFVLSCQNGDVETMYSLYYKDTLEKRFERTGVSREEYNSKMRSNMANIVGYDEFRYGSENMLTIKTPIDYVNEIYYQAHGTSFPYNNVSVEDCVNFRAYFGNGAHMDFMFAQIEGFWYAVL